MYRLARRGVRVEAPATPVSVERFSLAPTDAPHVWSFEIVVSTGTYVRALVRDLGRALACGAAVASLRRTVIGPLDVEDALRIPERRSSLSSEVRSRIIPIDAMPLSLPSIVIDTAGAASRFVAGVAVEDPEPGTNPALTAVRSHTGRLLGIGLRGEGSIKPRLVLAP
jgi:tRNA pseudouridine55 synthase